MPGTRPLSQSEQVAVRDALRAFPVRDRALVVVMMNTGFRISELLSLNVEDVWDDGAVRTRIRVPPAKLKGGRGVHRRSVPARSVVTNPAAVAVMAELVLGRHAAERKGPLFVSRKHRRLSRWQGNRVVQKVLAAAGLHSSARGELSTHALRKTFCTNVYRHSNNDINLTRAVMQHCHVNTTQAYLEVCQGEADKAVLALATLPRGIATLYIQAGCRV